MDRFKGKTVIVTGAGSGIGEGAARRFAAEGANVVLNGRSREKLDRVAAGLDAARRLVHVADVSRMDEVEAMVAAVLDRFGAIDVLVNNAGTAHFAPFEETTPEIWRDTFATDVDGVFFCCRAALPALKESRGNIVNVASVSGTGGDWSMSAYNAAKGAVVNFTRALALDLGRAGVRVNAVAPSFTTSDLTQDMLADSALVARFNERMPLGAPEAPDDIAGPIAFLASDDARMVTGAILAVDGGVSASNGQPGQG